MQNIADTQKIAQTSTLAAATDLVKMFLVQNPGLTAVEALDLLTEVHGRLVNIARPTSADAQPSAAGITAKREPAVAIEASVTDDHIICLEDGTKHQMMKRYLKRVYNLSPDEYRARWGLPADYPMTAPGYSARKREEARAVGLGTTANKAGINVGRELVDA